MTKSYSHIRTYVLLFYREIIQSRLDRDCFPSYVKGEAMRLLRLAVENQR